MAVFGTSVLDRAVYRQESGDMIVSWYRGNDTIYCDFLPYFRYLTLNIFGAIQLAKLSAQLTHNTVISSGY